MNKDAIISNCGKYRYSLYRKWAEGPSVLFIMLNPSTADANDDDPTIRRCISFAKKWGFGSLLVGNLYAFRSTDPDVVMRMGLIDAIGEGNKDYIEGMISRCSKIVVAWGVHGGKGTFEMMSILRGKKVYCLGETKHGSPKHPLYISKDKELESWSFDK